MSSKKNKVKVTFLHPDLGIGGAERLVLDVASSLTKQGVEVSFLTNHFDENHCFEELKTGEYPVEVYGDWLPRGIFGRCQALCAYIRMVYLTLMYVLFYRKDSPPNLYFVDLIPIAVPILKLFNQKVIYYCHHPDLLASNPGGELKKLYRKPIDWVEMKATAQANIILVNSEYTKSVFRDTFPEITQPIQVLYPTIAYSYQEAVKGINPKPIQQIVEEITVDPCTVFLSINRFHPAKKLDLAISAFDKLRQNITKDEWERVFLVMAGGYDPQSHINASYYNDLKNLTNSLDLQDKIIFLKSPSDDIKTELLASCTCLIYTPVKEHFGIVPLEAMAVGKPVIACNSGGPRETVKDGVTGYLCEPDDPESMANAIQKILNANCAEMGVKGKKVLEEKFSNASFSNCLKEVIQKLQ